MSIAELEEIRHANPEQVEVGLILGERYRRMGLLDDAETAFQRVLDNAGGAAALRAGALSGLGLSAQSRDDLDLAETRLREALEAAESAGVRGLAREQRERLAVLEQVRGDFVAACEWYERAGAGGAQTKLTTEIDCGDPREILALSASIWRAHASATMEGLMVEAMTTKTLAAEAEAAVASGDIKPAQLAPALGDYSTLVLYTEGAEAAEAVARRAIALAPRDGLLHAHLISPLILQGRLGEADAAAETVIRDWPADGPAGWSIYRQLNDEFEELTAAGLHNPYMDEVSRRLEERNAGR
jgi:tetratricopeptide (TPR) repeat protein